MERLELIHRIHTRTWREYLIQPPKCNDALWRNVSRRFKMTDLQTPVLTTITSASHGGKITRNIKKAYNLDRLKQAMVECGYDSLIRDRIVPSSHLYGTCYPVLGQRRGKFHVTLLPEVSTHIITPVDDVEDIQEIIAFYPNGRGRGFDLKGEFTLGYGEERSYKKNSNCGFIPIPIFRGRHMSAWTPYGEDLVYPATLESKQVTFLDNDITFLIRLQSYSTLVIKGATVDNNQNADAGGPTQVVRLQAGTENDAKFISPQAEIRAIDQLIESKFERTATQCQVPVEVFTKARSGTNQSAGSSYLSHKPLYDLVVYIQNRKREEEFEMLAQMSALLAFWETGRPQDLQKHRDGLEVDIIYERESNPSFNQSDMQTCVMAVDSGLMTHERAYWIINPDGTMDEQAALEKEREKQRSLIINRPGKQPGGQGISDRETNPGENRIRENSNSG